MKKIKILCIAPSLNKTSGVTQSIMNYYQKINHTEFCFDFLIMDNKDKQFNDMIKKNNDNIYIIEKLNIKNFFKINKEIKKFFEINKEKYDIVHCHTFNYGAFFLYWAKKYDIRVRILHIHVTKLGAKLYKQILNKFLIKITKKYANTYFACTEKAGNSVLKNQKYYLINNAIDIKKFKYSSIDRNKLRKENGIKDADLIIGTVGRLSKEKNQLFFLDICKEISKKKDNTKFIIIGNGPEKERLIQRSKELELFDKIIFKEHIININEYYSLMDVFILPSFHEGLGIVLIEAQFNGLPCFCNKTLPREVFMSDLIKGISLDDSAEKWADIIINSDLNRKNILIKENVFSIDEEVKKLESIYKKLVIIQPSTRE